MPERNLVPVRSRIKAIVMVALVAVVVIQETGCSRIGTNDFAGLLEDRPLTLPADESDAEVGSQWRRDSRDMLGVVVEDEQVLSDLAATESATDEANEDSRAAEIGFRFSNDVPDFVPSENAAIEAERKTPIVLIGATAIAAPQASAIGRPLSPILFDDVTHAVSVPEPVSTQSSREMNSTRRAESVPDAQSVSVSKMLEPKQPSKLPIPHLAPFAALPLAKKQIEQPPAAEPEMQAEPGNDFSPIVKRNSHIQLVSAEMAPTEDLTNAWQPPNTARPAGDPSFEVQSVEPDPAPPTKVASSEDTVDLLDVEQRRQRPVVSAADQQAIAEATAWQGQRQSSSVDLSSIEMPLPASEPTPTDSDLELTANENLAQTIQMLKQQLATTDGNPRAGMAVSLRLLEMLQRKLSRVSSEVLGKQSPLSQDEHRYWQSQLRAIATMLETDSVSTTGDSDLQRHEMAIQALRHLEDATDQLRSIAGLRIDGGHFCSEISGFGQYRTFESSDFHAGDRALLYVEVENHHAEPAGDSSDETLWRTLLRASYAIYDQQGRVVQQEGFPVIEDLARNRRRDFYLHLPLTIGDLSAGRYQLKIVVEDVGKTDSATMPAVEFVVR